MASNTIYFKEYSGSDPNIPLEGLVALPPGKYKTNSSPDLISTLETAINNQLGTASRFTVYLDQATNRITITNSTYIFEMYIMYPGTNRNINKTMGWTLGFRTNSMKLVWLVQIMVPSQGRFTSRKLPSF